MESSLAFDIEIDEIEVFVQDVNEHLQAIESGVLQLEQPESHGQSQGRRAADSETLDSVFRAAHTLKAVAGAVGHRSMAELTHTLETLFDAMRQGRLSPTQQVADDLLATVDVLRSLRDEVVSRQPGDVDVASMLAGLRAWTDGSREAALPDGGEGALALDTSAEQAPGVSEKRRPADRPLTPEETIQAQRCYDKGHHLFEINITADRESFAPAARFLQAVMGLAETGQVIAQRPLEGDLLKDRHDGHLWLIIATKADAHAVERCLGAVSDLAAFHVQPYTPDAAPGLAGRDGGSPSPGRDEAEGQPTPPAPLRAGPVVVEGEQTVRISVERLDVLMDLVGEMVTDRTRLEQIKETLRAQYGKEENVTTLDETISHVGQIIDQLQDEVMRARMLPIAHLFEKFPRLVRDLARAAGKQVCLVVEGEGTELDRSVIEAIGDPLIHLLRNAIDHGIEPPEVRTAAGKPPTGSVQLTAEHAEGQIVVTVEDDGRGIDPQRIRGSAVSRGLLPEEDAVRLGDDEAITLIFEPGLSTADEVTGVSGRGVGLDVVRTNIGRIGGSVAVESEVGQGTVFRITLPLTLAIVQTMLVAVGDDVYAIPLTGIVESLYLSDVTVHGIKGNPAIQWRDRVLPLLHLRHFFHALQRSIPDLQSPNSKSAIVVASWGKLQAGLIADRIIGKQEIVVKPLGPIVGNVAGLSGCTILGDGRIALIVDIAGLINVAMQARAQRTRAAQKSEAS